MKMDKRLKILIADDDADTLYVYSRLLESEGYESLTAPSAFECLRIARQERPDLILLDVRLPDISGLEVCRQIKADPKLSGIFVIHISGIDISSDNQAEALESGADLYLTKPVEYRKLLAHIRALLRIKSDVSSTLLDQQNRELASLDHLSSAPRASVAAQIFGPLPLRKHSPEIFAHLAQLYGELLDLALQQRAYKIEHNLAERLHAIVDRLGMLKAGPRDVVDLHQTALKLKAAQSNFTKAQAYVEEGRMRLVEMMGYLAAYYRTLSLGTVLSGVSDGDATRPSAEEQTDE
jgi:DNA-binding response OmpR family regulator